MTTGDDRVDVVPDSRVATTRELIASWHPLDERGRLSKRSAISFIESVRDPFSRDVSSEHVTASAVVLSSAGVLLHRHKLAGVWLGPGGHVDGGESPDEAVLREVLEETGVRAHHPHSGVCLVDIDSHVTANAHVHHDLRFALLSKPDEPMPGPGESTAVGWFPVEIALGRVSEWFEAALVAANALHLARP